jgi:hypothetical protein
MVGEMMFVSMLGSGLVHMIAMKFYTEHFRLYRATPFLAKKSLYLHSHYAYDTVRLQVEIPPA